MAKDISMFGLNPNELPVVIPGPNGDGRYLVMDGNRRIACIKLMTQYKQNLDMIGIGTGQKKAFANLKCSTETIPCVVYEDEDLVNALIEKLHTSKPGVGQVKWDPQAQDRHQYKNGSLSRRLALIEMLRASVHTPPNVRDILSQSRWTSKLHRYVRNDDYILFFGIKFDSNNNIILYIDESESIKALSQLVIDLKEKSSTEIAQTSEAIKQYLKDFPPDKKPNNQKSNNPLIFFNVDKGIFEETNIYNYGMPHSDNKFNTKNKTITKTSTDIKKQNTNNPDTGNFKKENSSLSLVNESSSLDLSPEKGQDQDNIKRQERASIKISASTRPTNDRTTLIPKDEEIPIKNQRTLDLYNELKLISIAKYINVVSISLRSLIEFSINCFLISKSNNFANNEQIPLFQKLEKVISVLESIYTKKILEQEYPAIYRSMDTYIASGKKSDLNSIPNLHLLIHNHNYHPTERELKDIYNNYSPFLKRIWGTIQTTN
ncbi:MAG: hypothetical protein M1486_01875 [Gammaproteobacteria bacterium]|nr:hypothetical protein [Gammaproteobacteria bacterium]